MQKTRTANKNCLGLAIFISLAFFIVIEGNKTHAAEPVLTKTVADSMVSDTLVNKVQAWDIMRDGTYLRDGKYVTAWVDNYDEPRNLYFQLYSAAGAKNGANVLIAGTVSEKTPTIAAFADGFAVFLGNQYWRYTNSGVLISGPTVFAPSFRRPFANNFPDGSIFLTDDDGVDSAYLWRFDAVGAPAATNPSIKLNDGVSNESYTALAEGPNGAAYPDGTKYVTVWKDSRNGIDSVMAQLVNADGSLDGVNFPVSNTSSTPAYRSAFYVPTVTVNENNELLFTWYDSRNSGDDYNAQVYGRIFYGAGASKGQPKTGEFIIGDNLYDTPSGQNHIYGPADTIALGDKFLVSYVDKDVVSNGENHHIKGRIVNADGTFDAAPFVLEANNASGKGNRLTDDAHLSLFGTDKIAMTWFDTRDNNILTGAELVTNGAFVGSDTSWTANGGWAYNGAVSGETHAPGSVGTLEQAVPLITGPQQYKLTYTLSGVTAGTLDVTVGGATFGQRNTADWDINGVQDEYFNARNLNNLVFTAGDTFDGTISNVTIQVTRNTSYQVPYVNFWTYAEPTAVISASSSSSHHHKHHSDKKKKKKKKKAAVVVSVPVRRNLAPTVALSSKTPDSIVINTDENRNNTVQEQPKKIPVPSANKTTDSKTTNGGVVWSWVSGVGHAATSAVGGFFGGIAKFFQSLFS